MGAFETNLVGRFRLRTKTKKNKQQRQSYWPRAVNLSHELYTMDQDQAKRQNESVTYVAFILAGIERTTCGFGRLRMRNNKVLYWSNRIGR